MARLREAIQAENSAAGPERRQRTSELRFMDSPEAGRVSADMPGNTETAGEPEEKPEPGRIRPGWDTAAVVRAQEEADNPGSDTLACANQRLLAADDSHVGFRDVCDDSDSGLQDHGAVVYVVPAGLVHLLDDHLVTQLHQLQPITKVIKRIVVSQH